MTLPTPEELRSLLRYDPETGRLFWLTRPVEMFSTERAAKSWNARNANKEALTSHHSNGYRTGGIHHKTHYAHRVAYAIYHGEFPSEDIDHINGDRTDNRIENLRAVSRSVNVRNTKMSSRNTSGVNGVCWSKQEKKWRAHIMINGRQKSLGRFDNIEDAVAARKAAEIGEGYTARHGGKS